MSESPNSRMFGFAAMLRWAKKWARYRYVLALLLALCYAAFGTLCHAQTINTIEVKNSTGDIVFYLHFYAGGTLPIDPAIEDATGVWDSEQVFSPLAQEQIDAIVRAFEYWAERIAPANYAGQGANIHIGEVLAPYNAWGVGTILRAFISNNSSPNGTVGIGFPPLDFVYDLNSQLQESPGASMEAVVIHEIGHILGITTYENNWNQWIPGFEGFPRDPISGNILFDDLVWDPNTFRAVFQGPEAMRVYGDDGLWESRYGVSREVLLRDWDIPFLWDPVNGLSHFDLRNALMTHLSYRNFTGFIEVEMAALNDIGYNINLRQFFGRSFYVDDQVITYTDGFFEHDGTGYLDGVYNTASYAVGLHIFANNIDITVTGKDILSIGVGSAGIRSDGFDNIIRIDKGINVHANGERGTGLLVSYGAGTRIIHQGNLQAVGQDGIAARFDFGHNVLGIVGEPDHTSALLNEWGLGSSLVESFDVSGSISGDAAAIYIANSAWVDTINFMNGTSVTGAIISFATDYNTLLTFGKLMNTDGTARNLSDDAGFVITVSGNIFGSFNIETWGGMTLLDGEVQVRSGFVGLGTADSVLILPDNSNFDFLDVTTLGEVDGVSTGLLRVYDTLTNAGRIHDFVSVRADGRLINTGVINSIDTLRAGKITNEGWIYDVDTIEVLSGSTGNWDVVYRPDGSVEVTYNPGGGSGEFGFQYDPNGDYWDYYYDPITDSYIFFKNPNGMWGPGNPTLIAGGAVYGDFHNGVSGILEYVGTLTARNVVNEGLMSDIGTIKTVNNVASDGTVLTNSGYLNNINIIKNVDTLDIAGNLANSGMLEQITTINVGANFSNSGWVEQVNTISVAGTFSNNGWTEQVNTIAVTGNFTNGTDAYLGHVGTFSARSVVNVGLMEQINAMTVTNSFINNGVVRDIGTIHTGSVENTGIFNTISTITVGKDLKNVGGVIANVKNLSVDGNVNNWSDGTNVGIIGDVNNFLISGTLTNNNGAVVDINNIQAGDVKNTGQMADIGTLTISGRLDNSGDIWDVGMLSASNAANTGYIVNVESIAIRNNLSNNGALANSAMLTAGNIVNMGYMMNIDQIRSNSFLNQNGVIAGIRNIDLGGSGTFVNQGGMIVVGNSSISTDLLGNIGYTLDSVGTLAIDGNFTSTQGTFVIGIKDSNNSVIDVSGSALIDGGNVHIEVEPLRYVVDHKYVFLSTGAGLTVNGELMPATINDPLFKVVMRYDTDDYWLSIARAFAYGGEGDTLNQRALGKYLDQVGIYPAGDFRSVLMALDRSRFGTGRDERWDGIAPMATFFAEDDIEDPLHKALAQMGGSIYGTMTTASFQNTVTMHASLANVLRRDYNTVNGVNAYYGRSNYFPTGNLWGMVYGHAGRSSHDGNVDGYRQGFSGMMIGLDRLNEKQRRLGLFISAGQGSLSSELQDRAISDEFMVGHYFRKDGNYGYILAQAGLGTHRYDTRRNISFGGYNFDDGQYHLVDRTAKNQHSAFLATAHFETGLRYRNRVLNLSPFVGVQYTGLIRQGFTEREAGSLNLTSDMEDYHSFRTMFGMRFDSVPFRLQRGLISFYGNTAWSYEFEANKRHTEFSARFTDAGVLTGPTFTVNGNDPGRDWVQAGVGMNYDFNANLRGFAGYDAYANQRQVLHSANLGLIYQR